MIVNEQSSRSSDPAARRPRPVPARPNDSSGSRTIVIRQGGGWQSLAVFLLCLLLLAVVLLGHQALADLNETLIKQVVERVEAIAWEVIPQMAEALVKDEIRRMKGDDE